MYRRKVIKISAGVISLSLLCGTFKGWLMGKEPLAFHSFESQRSLLAELAETIIPETDSPGAKSADVASYLLLVIADCLTTKEQKIFYKGLGRVEKTAINNFDRSFIVCDELARVEVLKAVKHHEGPSMGLLYKIRRRLWGRSFMDLLTEHVVTGYCTSERGATMGLAYEAIPVKYEACTVLADGQKAWATH